MKYATSPGINASAVRSAATSAALTMGNCTALSAFRNLPALMKNDDYFMSLALSEAEKAFTENEVPVGAVIVKDGQVIASAHNTTEASHDPTAHAELSAIREATAKTGDVRLTGSVLYVTKEPCVMCAGAMINARLGRLVFGCHDERYGAISSRYQLAHDPGLNHQIRVVSRVLEDECADILRKFFRTRR